MDLFTDEERQKYLGGIISELFPLAQKNIWNWQNNWDRNRPFEDFKIQQNKQIRKILELEISNIGKSVRKVLGLKEIDWTTNIPD